MDDNKDENNSSEQEGDSMSTLQEIRELNKRRDLLFVGMEKEPVTMPLDLGKKEKDFYNKVIKPHVKHSLKKYFNKTR